MEVRRPLKIDVPGEVYNLALHFLANGYKLFLVGGAVRDAVMGKEPKDYDLATDATPEQVKDILRGKYELIEVGEAFGVIAVVLPKPLEKLEIATFREDLSAGRHPVVRFATIAEDVQRRDLTINALFYDISTQEVVDLVGGLEDLDGHGQIRTVGSPHDRFAEDKLRKLRAIRFAVKLGFDMHGDTYHSIQEDNNLDGVSFERVRDEFIKAVAGAKSPKRLMKLMDAFNMWERVLPGLKASTCLDSLVSSRGIDSNNVPVVLALLLDGEDPETVGKRLNYLKYNADEVAQVSFLLRLRDVTPETAPKVRKAFFQSKLSTEDVEEYMRIRGLPDRAVADAFFLYLASTPYKGEPLMAQGFSGKALGQELQRMESRLFSMLVEGRQNITPDALG